MDISESMDTATIDLAEKSHVKNKLPWYHASSFLLLWPALFFAVAYPLYNAMPKPVNIDEELYKPGQFVSERAQHLLLELDRLGPKIIGDEMNEKTMIEFLLREMDSVHREMRHDLYTLEVDVQRASGAYLAVDSINMYQAVQNVIVKLTPRQSNSSAYLLVNSHYDTKVGSVGAGDAGSMVVTMLEVLRQLATSNDSFEHPVIFLFNGAEESELHGSHAFITQHKWSPSCKALINVDSLGAGGRELLFRAGPFHPWLIRHYKAAAKHPFGTTLAEEIFESRIANSKSDFGIFRDYGPLPGLDMVVQYNGFVYHTKYDRFDVISRDSLQSTGDNLLALVRSISNAKEMRDIKAHAKGRSVYFDFLGLFFVSYLESTAIFLNIGFGGGGIIIVYFSLWYMSNKLNIDVGTVVQEFAIMFLMELVSFGLALGLPMLIATFYDAGKRTMTYFTNSWLVIGIYIVPSIIGLVLPVTIYLIIGRNKRIPSNYRLQIAGHAHCIFFALLCIVLTILSVRSAYLFMISLLFYVGALCINMISKLHERGYFWSLVLGACQAIPFLYFSYLFYACLVIYIPLTGRTGTTANPDLQIAILCAAGTILALGFLAPLINVFRYPVIIIGIMTATTFLFVLVSVSELGFPYRPRTNVMRLNFLQVNRKLYDYNGSISHQDAGYYFGLHDHRKEQPLRDKLDLTGMVGIADTCDCQMRCGLPCGTQRWLPRTQPVQMPGDTTLELLNKTVVNSGYSIRYSFQLTGPSRMTIYLMPLEGVKMVDWSFLRGMLDSPAKYKPPYQISFTWGADSSPIKFYVELTKTNGKFNEPVFEIGIAGHYLSHVHKRDALSALFIKEFPDFVNAVEWPTSYDRYIY